MNQALLAVEDAPGPRAELRDPHVTVAFMLAGNAHVTFQSERTGTRFTYHVRLADRRPGDTRTCHFVSVLTGPDHYDYLGCIYAGRAYAQGAKSRIPSSAKSSIAFVWVWTHLLGGKMHPELGVWHEGRCGKCGRRLTTPESIASGIGPVCVGRDA
jgi:hypothetical protein